MTSRKSLRATLTGAMAALMFATVTSNVDAATDTATFTVTANIVDACDVQATLMTLPVAGLAEVLEMFPGVDAALASERARSER
jgi:hypothetical protein